MSRFRESLLLVTLSAAALAVQAAPAAYPGIGRDAKPAEVKAWDIDVRPDFKGLPKGSGSVSQGCSSVKCVTHCLHEQGIRVTSVPQNIRRAPNASRMRR